MIKVFEISNPLGKYDKYILQFKKVFKYIPQIQMYLTPCLIRCAHLVCPLMYVLCVLADKLCV